MKSDKEGDEIYKAYLDKEKANKELAEKNAKTIEVTNQKYFPITPGLRNMPDEKKKS